MIYKWLGQEISVGNIVGDLWGYNTQPNILFSGEVSTWWNPITYILSVDDALPTSNKVYDIDIDGNIHFYIYVNFTDSTHFKIGYVIQPPPFDVASLTYNPSNVTINVNNVTEHDALCNGVAFFRVGITSTSFSNMQGLIGISYGMLDSMTMTTPQINLGTGEYEFDTDVTPNRFIWTETGECYRSHLPVVQYSFLDTELNPEKKLLLETLGEEISSFDEDYAEPSGGYGGEYKFYSDNIDFSSLPSLSIIDAGIATMWNPSSSEMKDFTDFLWSSNFFDNILKLIADPLDNVIQFGVVPFSIPASYKGTQKEVKVGNVGTGVLMTPLNTQYVSYDCGGITIPEAWKTCMDYEPMTTLSIFIPSVGFVTMTANEVMNASDIHLRYNIDLLSGDCIAEVKITKNFSKGVSLSSVVYHKSGNIMQQMPLTGANYGRIFQSMLHTASNFGASVIGGNILGAVDSAMNIPSLEVERTNGYTGSTTILGCEQPYIFLSQPIQVFDSLYPSYEGYPSYLAYSLSDLKGYTKVESLIDNTVSATDEEKREIERLLKEGVVL